MSKAYMMVTITNRQLRNQFQDLFEKNEMAPVFGALGRGTAEQCRFGLFRIGGERKGGVFLNRNGEYVETTSAGIDY